MGIALKGVDVSPPADWMRAATTKATLNPLCAWFLDVFIPGAYRKISALSDDDLVLLTIPYLQQDLLSAKRMRKVLLPVLLRYGKVTREQLKNEFVEMGEVTTKKRLGTCCR